MNLSSTITDSLGHTGRKPGISGWKTEDFLQHLKVLFSGPRSGRVHTMVFRSRLDWPPPWSAADQSAPRLRFARPHGLVREAIGVAARCPITSIPFLPVNSADFSADRNVIDAIEAWLRSVEAPTNCAIYAEFPQWIGENLHVPIQLWLPRVWLSELPDHTTEIAVVCDNATTPAETLRQVEAALVAAQSKCDLTPAKIEANGAVQIDFSGLSSAIDCVLDDREQTKLVWATQMTWQPQVTRRDLAENMKQTRGNTWQVDVQLADGRNALCASPELLVHTHGAQITTAALAGTIGKNSTNQHEKLRLEHQIVCDDIKQRLAALGTRWQPPTEATAVQHGELLHWRTAIQGQRPPELSALRAALALHPTPALLGLPRLRALQQLTIHEQFCRTWYGGFAGVLAADGSGDGELIVLLRGAAFVADAAVPHWQVCAGAGLVAGSTFADESAEIAQKLRSILHGFGDIRG